jgi:hypothetical protein
MALVLADRVKETTTTTGTGTVTLLGASTGFQSFAVVGNGNTTFYTIASQTNSEWEVGIGTYTASGTTLARTTVLSSSNSGSLVNFSAGTKDVFVTYPSSRSIYADGTTLTATNSSVLPATSGGTGQSSAFTQYGVTYASTTTALATTAAGTAGYVLTANAGAAPTFQAGFSASANNTFTGTQTFNGTSSIFATVLLDSAETVNVVAAAPSSTTNFYVQSGSVQYYTSNAANNWTLNVAFSSGTSMNTALAIGQSVTFVLVTTQSTTAYYNSAVTIDGTSVTPKWIGGAPTAGNASGLDVYRYAVVKTASATYTVLASLTQYK